METLSGKFQQVRKYCDQYNVAAVLISGDLFDSKHGTKISYETSIKAAQHIKLLGLQVFAIAGNHDTSLNSIDNHPLKFMFESGILTRATNIPQYVSTQNGQNRVGIAGFDHSYTTDMSRFSAINPEQDAPLIGLIHMMIGLKSGKFYSEDRLGIEEFTQSNVNLFCNGHEHTSLPQMINSKGQIFVQPGAFRRTNTASEEIDRVPQITLITVAWDSAGKSTISTEYLPIQIKSDIFKDWKREIKSEKKDELKGFLERVQSMRDSTQLDINTLIKESDLEPEVREILESYVGS